MHKFLFFANLVLAHLKNEAKFAFMAGLFGLPLYIVAFAEPHPLNGVFTVASLVLLAYFMIGFYVQSIGGWQELLPFLDRLSQGDLTATYDGQIDRVGQLSKARAIATNVNEHFSNIVAQARSGADHITAAAKEIATGNINLSRRTEEQATMLKETASSMEQLSARVKRNADSCLAARSLADQANAVAIQGGEMMDKLIGTMALINKGSSRVSEITAVIERIAFQTNILALNAAVESERAGQQGRGFAVVASEVRSLAQRSAAAAKEIKTLIEESVSNVEHGTTLVDDTGRVIKEVAASVQKVTQRIAEIATASAEQSSSVAEINRAITQLEHVTQQNAARVEEGTAAVLSLEHEAAGLAEAVSKFKLSTHYRVATPTPAPAADIVHTDDRYNVRTVQG